MDRARAALRALATSPQLRRRSPRRRQTAARPWAGTRSPSTARTSSPERASPLVARRVASLGSFPGRSQAIPAPDPATGMVAATGWTRTTTLTIPTDWVSGVYLAKLTGSPSGHQSFIFFVVRNDGGHEKYVFQNSVTTYQAYNIYGGTSLYDNQTNKSVYSYGHATKVSFDRPFDPLDGNGAGQFTRYEYPWVRWAESQGYDLTYITDVD